jgi:hypothetical protein
MGRQALDEKLLSDFTVVAVVTLNFASENSPPFDEIPIQAPFDVLRVAAMVVQFLLHAVLHLATYWLSRLVSSVYALLNSPHSQHPIRLMLTLIISCNFLPERLAQNNGSRPRSAQYHRNRLIIYTIPTLSTPSHIQPFYSSSLLGTWIHSTSQLRCGTGNPINQAHRRFASPTPMLNSLPGIWNQERSTIL